MTATLAAAQLPSALGTMTTATVVGILCAAVVVEIVVLPAVLLPGGTITLLAGAMIGTGRPAFAVAIPVAAAVIGGDQLAYVTGTAVTSWWRHRSGRRPIRHGPRQAWFVAAFPSFAGAAGLRYRPFAVRALVLRIPWLAAALGAGALAADSIARIGHVAGIVGIAASCLVVAGLLIARRRAASARRAKD
jgi:membrane protein DedA with SNARE-associated domain